VVKRTTISINAALFDAAIKRSKAMNPPYKSFSEYVGYLIEKDCREGANHTIVRETDGPYGVVAKKRSSG
jgi:hypothetical protein